MVTVCTTSLTFNNSTFCPHSVFMCFVWIWEQTAIISLYSINWLVFITEIQPSKSQWSLYVPPVQYSQNLRSAHTVYLCVLCGSENKERSFPYTTLTDWFSELKCSVFTARYELELWIDFRFILTSEDLPLQIPMLPPAVHISLFL